MKLWGLVVCHHTSPRFIPFPLRYACEFLMQAFGLQLNMELQLASQMSEKHILRTQTLLCDMILRESPTGIVTQSPSIMDLVKCDGAALYYQGKYWPLGVTPTEAQIKDIVQWLSACHGDSAGLSTDSLADAGYPGAAALGDAVCGMAVAYITPTGLLVLVSVTPRARRSNGAVQSIILRTKMMCSACTQGPSFKAFLGSGQEQELALGECLEMDAIHSLQLILRDSFKDAVEGTSNSKALWIQMGRINGWNAKVAELTGLSVEDAMGRSLVQDLVFKESTEVVDKLLYRALRGEEDKNVEIKLRTFGSQQSKNAVFVIVNACSSRDYMKNIVGVCFIAQDVTGQKVVMDKFIHIQGDYKAIVHSPNPLIPPIFASDEDTCCSEWNTAMEKLTGWSRRDMIGKLLVGEVFGSCCRLKGPDAMTKFMIVLHNAISGQETDKFPFAFFDKNGKFVQALLTANTRNNMDGRDNWSLLFLADS
ncbi:hypothetical protein J5N97_014099 [Dioscorea zingiberensis]|uniref:Phytochrome B n=1 Tax=Dioscorea zingiberensis TaxID=325984 RepID=A0A9D5CUL0_9LILI|nr:hypothetical protein J5N97_014099 [Dioscorea zingiberensis]